MICPHCKKIIITKVSKECLRVAKRLIKEGYSFRDAETYLKNVGFNVSAATICRALKGFR